MKAALITIVVAGCATAPPAGTIRFVVQPPVTRVDDARPLEHKPAERIYNRTLYQLDGFVVRRATRAMDFPEQTRALDVNSIDEVPDSTWFTNRIGVRDMSIEEVRRGPDLDDSPLDHLPLTIIGAKEGGTSLGFVVEDGKHDKYLLKFDGKAMPEMETGAHIIGHRILWACGYNVPEDYLGYVRREDIVIGEKAALKDLLGHKTPLTAQRVDKALESVYRADDGKFRVMISRFVPGTPIGPYAREGTRHDDPNDRIPHERRRTVRGEVPLFSWLNHTDIQEDNSLDSFVPEAGDSKDSKRGHVVHFLIDFGKAFGVMNASNNWKTVGYTYRLDVGYGLMALLTLGLWSRPWDEISEAPRYRGIALFDAEHFEPGEWRTNSPYWPFDESDRFDGFWGAKIAMRFTRPQIEAIVGEAKFSDPRASKYMVDTLIARQARLGRYWFGKLSPLDRFTVTAEGGDTAKLCFDDLALLYGLERGQGTYTLEVFDRGGRTISAQAQPTAEAGHACFARVPLSSASDRYTIVKLAAVRHAHTLPPVRVHLARTARAPIDVIGLRRD